MFSDYINKLVQNKEIPGGVLLVQQDGVDIFHDAFGHYHNNDSKQPFMKDTIFDIASLTKVVATLPACLRLITLNELSLDNRVQDFFPNFKYTNITVEHLLRHNSGLPADLSYCPRDEKRDVMKDVLKAELEYETGTKTVYSDLGMILLGKIIEKVSGKSLDQFTKEEIFLPFEMTETNYGISKDKLLSTASTEMFKGKYVHGEVHDEKAFHLNGVSGSAGVFSTARDIGKYAQVWLNRQSQNVLEPTLMDEAVMNVHDQRGLSFQVWDGTEPALSCGSYWPVGSFGHTGFTGTSLWIDPINKINVVFLTNIVQFGRKHNMIKIRKELHTLVHQKLVD
ncbi:serine hydrolase domain-containing protein [Bacillaceae bacterium W0354]